MKEVFAARENVYFNVGLVIFTSLLAGFVGTTSGKYYFWIGDIRFTFASIFSALVLYCLYAIRKRIGVLESIAAMLYVFAIETSIAGPSPLVLASGSAFFSAGIAIVVLSSIEVKKFWYGLIVLATAVFLDTFLYSQLSGHWTGFRGNLIFKLLLIPIYWIIGLRFIEKRKVKVVVE